MESQWIVDRARLRQLSHQRHGRTQKELAQEIGYSVSWVKKWLKRFAEAEPDDHSVLLSKPRAPCERQKRVKPEVERKILEIRDHPPEN